jgi:hypothetical protein
MKKKYEKPRAIVVKLEHQSHILVESIGTYNAGVQNYEIGDEQNW